MSILLSTARFFVLHSADLALVGRGEISFWSADLLKDHAVVAVGACPVLRVPLTRLSEFTIFYRTERLTG